jgi:small subunit ribosomal protein S2
MSDQTSSNQVSLMSLYQVGAQRGNKKSRLNPRLKKAIYGYNNGLCLIDLVKTQESMQECIDLLTKLGSKRRQILVVGTSKHIQTLVQEYASKFNTGPMPYVNSRWLGGTLTNWSTIKKTLKTLEKLEKIQENKEFFAKLSKNEQLNLGRKKEKIMKFFSGLTNLKTSKPGAMIILDTSHNPIAIHEADSVGVPIIALTNTNTTALPASLKHTVVCNINSIKAVDLIMNTFIEAYNEGTTAVVQPKVNTEKTIEEKVK